MTPLPRDAQADERRRQLVRIANDLIEAEGVDAVTLPRVTELAGCARTLVYRYFASREELLVGVLRDYFERLDARISAAEQRAVVASFVAKPSVADAGLRELIAVFWDVQVAAGLGGAILRTVPRLNAQTEALVDESRRTYERRFTDPLRDAGLGEIESRVALDSMIASFVGLSLRWRAGEIDRETAIDVHTRATVGLIRGLLEGRTASVVKSKRRAPRVDARTARRA